jgi:DMSO reductase anchor subunit
MEATGLIAIAFGIFNTLRLVSYIPQIIAVARDQHGATAISLWCWSIWIGANATAALYAWVNVGDQVLALVSAFNAICCAIVVAIALLKRIRKARTVSPAHQSTASRQPEEAYQ